jgi:hypothetical protein
MPAVEFDSLRRELVKLKNYDFTITSIKLIFAASTFVFVFPFSIILWMVTFPLDWLAGNWIFNRMPVIGNLMKQFNRIVTQFTNGLVSLFLTYLLVGFTLPHEFHDAVIRWRASSFDAMNQSQEESNEMHEYVVSKSKSGDYSEEESKEE